MKTCVILNPAADKGRAARLRPRIEMLLQQAGVDADLVLTAHPWHAADLAQQGAADGYDVIAAAGGDGTANEVLNGLMALPQGPDRPVMACLPVGRGNDFAFGMGVPTDLEGACQALADGRRRTIDVGHVVGGRFPEGRYFGNGIGIGFDAVVGFEAAKLRYLSGFAGYVVAALKTISLYNRGPVVTLTYADPATGQNTVAHAQILMISIMNGRRMGGGFLMAPDGDPGDGTFHLCVARQMSRRRVFATIPHFMRGTQSGRDDVTMIRTPRLVITADAGPLPAHSDGETLCTEGQRLDVRLLPAQLDIITGAQP